MGKIFRNILFTWYKWGSLFLQFSGGCQGCSQASATLRPGIERLLKFYFINKIEDMTEHRSGKNPYY
ncbi:MAG: hypothetical protein E2O68_05215 [Deltaproteobacteria bacterium]|nr:MAG: hypothetical protein E2O68_05215 [Deltaproteobacteria bacterium]